MRKLRGEENLWRLRVGDWRVLFSRDQDRHVIDVLAVRPRGRAYRKPSCSSPIAGGQLRMGRTLGSIRSISTTEHFMSPTVSRTRQF